MKPIQTTLENGTAATLHCTYARKWPPATVAFSGDETVDGLWMGGGISEHEYEQIKTWRRVCGLLEMKAEKCLTCPCALKETKVLHKTVLAPVIAPPSTLPTYLDPKKTRTPRHG